MEPLAKPPDMLDAGDPAPDFDLPRPTAEGAETYRLSAAAGEGPVVLAFYSLTDPERAARLLRELAAVDWASVTERLAVLAVGVGTPAAHEQVAARVDVPFPLLLDRQGFFADRYGLLEPVDEETVRVRPGLFVVGEDCFVRYSWAQADPATDAERSLPLDAVRAAIASN